MKTRFALSLTVLAASAALAACGEKTAEAPKTDGMMDQMPMGDGMMSNDAAAAGSTTAKTAKGSGVVTEVDKTAGTITIDHGEIPEAGWPAMTMGFEAASPQMLEAVKVGDKVDFELALRDGAGEITAIQAR